MSGEARESARHPDRPVVELRFGIVVYPPEADGEPWRAVFTENGQRRYRQGATEAKLAAKLEKVTERLSAGAARAAAEDPAGFAEAAEHRPVGVSTAKCVSPLVAR